MNEDFSRLYSRDLPDAEARALEHRIATEPDVAAAWRSFLRAMEALESLPDALPAPPLRRARRSWTAAIPWALAAAAMLALAIRPATPELVLAEGSQLVEGELSLLAGDATVDVDGRVWIAVEPRTGVLRVERPEGDPMRKDTWLAGLAGAAVTIVVYEGSAVVRASEGAQPVTVGAGGTHRIDGTAPAPAAPRTPEERLADVARLTAELEAAQKALAEAKFEGAITRGQLVAMQGVPSEWPAHVPAAVSPENFRKELEAQLADLKDVEVAEVDCEEFPCIAAVRFDGDPAAHGSGPEDGWHVPIESQVGDWLKSAHGGEISLNVSALRFRHEDKAANYVIFGGYGADAAAEVAPRMKYRVDALVDDLGDQLEASADEPQP